MEHYPQLFIVYVDGNSKDIVMRVYFHKDMFKRDFTVDQFVIHEFLHSKLLKVVIRGINGITSASVLKEFVPVQSRKSMDPWKSSANISSGLKAPILQILQIIER